MTTTAAPANPPATKSEPPFNWRSYLKVHPAADLFPLMPEDELKALAEDIKNNGLQAPIVIDRSGEVVDGRNRLDAMAMLGWLLPPQPRRRRERTDSYEFRLKYTPLSFTDESPVADETSFEVKFGDPYALALSLNVHRRHLTREQKRDLIAKVLQHQPEASDRQIAKAVHVDHKTVGAVRSDMEGRGEIPHVDMRADTRGRNQPSSRKSTGRPQVDAAAETAAAFDRPRDDDGDAKPAAKTEAESPEHVDGLTDEQVRQVDGLTAEQLEYAEVLRLRREARERAREQAEAREQDGPTDEHVRGPEYWERQRQRQRATVFEMWGIRTFTREQAKDRETLVRCLGMLGSAHDGEILNAGRQVEKLRRKLGIRWDSLIVPAPVEPDQDAA